MADPFLENAGGWTPVPDVLFREYGFETAYAWGRIRRICQQQGGTYTASHEAIGKRIGMSRRNLIDKLNLLIRDGYIEDLTPGLRNRPHTYSTKKGEAKITSAMQISHTENDMPQGDNELGMRNLHSDNAKDAHPDPFTMQNLHTEDAEIAQPAMQNLHLKRESLETLKETKKKEKIPPKGGGKPPLASTGPESKAMFSALAQVCGLDIKLLTEENRGALNQAEKIMRENGYNPADLVTFGGWWSTHDWRGKQGDEPTLTQIRETWGRFRKWQQGNGHLGDSPPDPIPPPVRTPEQLIWQQVLADSPQIPQWLAAEIKPIQRSNGTFKLAVSSDSAKQWIDNRLVKVIKPTLNRIDQSISEIEVIVQ